MKRPAPPEGREQRDGDPGSGSHLSSKFAPIRQSLLLRRCRELAPEVLERRLECHDRRIDVGLGAACASRVVLRSTSIRSMFCLAAFKPLIAAISACAPLRLGLRLELVDAGVRRMNLRGDFVLVGLSVDPVPGCVFGVSMFLLLFHISGAFTVSPERRASPLKERKCRS